MTALRRAGPGRVALEVDGRAWRLVPDQVVARAGLAAGVALDRPTLRRLRRELRRAEAFAAAGRALARRDLSRERLGERLRRAGAAPAEERLVLEALERSRLVDDERLARSRARALADRGWGDEAIAARLEPEGFPADVVRAALNELAPEPERAARVAAAGPDRLVAARRLARRGFSSDAIEAAVGPLDEGLQAELGYE